ncbi:hypothetical protein ACMFMG_007081 [Clarireedia jacksonii]
MHFTLINVLALAAAVMAATIHVDVGKEGLQFSPDKIVAADGDQVAFHFYSKHSVASSSFFEPCVSGPNDFFSGVLTGDDAGVQTWTLPITNVSAIWLYCSVGKHCQAGMTAVINEPGRNKTLDAYKQTAANVQAAQPPASPQGGTISTATGVSASVVPSATASASGVGNSTANQTTTHTATSVLQTSHTATVTSTGSASSATATKGAANRRDQMSVVGWFVAVVGGLAAFII